MSVGRAILQSVERTICLSRLAVPGRLHCVGGSSGISPARFVSSRRVWFGFFRPFGHSPPRCHSDIYRGHLRTTQGFGRDQLTIYPPSTRLGLGWAPTNPYWGVWVYTGSSWRSPSHHSVMAYRSRSCRASSERRLEHRASDLYAGSLVPLYLIIFRVKCSNSVLLPDISAEIFPLPTVTLCQQTMYTISNTHFFPSGEPMTVMDIYIPGEPKTAKRKIGK